LRDWAGELLGFSLVDSVPILSPTHIRRVPADRLSVTPPLIGDDPELRQGLSHLRFEFAAAVVHVDVVMRRCVYQNSIHHPDGVEHLLYLGGIFVLEVVYRVRSLRVRPEREHARLSSQ
jgi:hypothetical protein